MTVFQMVFNDYKKCWAAKNFSQRNFSPQNIHGTRYIQGRAFLFLYRSEYFKKYLWVLFHSILLWYPRANCWLQFMLQQDEHLKIEKLRVLTLLVLNSKMLYIFHIFLPGPFWSVSLALLVCVWTREVMSCWYKSHCTLM